MYTFLDNYHQGVKYSAHMESHQDYLRREEKIVDHKSLSISALQINDLNLESSVKNTERASLYQSRCSDCGGSHPTENTLSNIEKILEIINKTSISVTLIIIWVMDIKV